MCMWIKASATTLWKWSARPGASDVALGSSPRGSLALFRASQAWAFYNGRDFVIPDDVRKMVIPVLSHRIMLKQEAKLKKINPVEILNYIVSRTNVPVVN